MTRGHARAVGLLAGAVVLLGLAMRIRLLHSAVGRLDSDEAVVGLMGERFRHGDHSLFFWGQYYGGVLEPLLVGAFLLVHRSTLFVKLVPLLCSGLLGVVVWRCGLRLMDRRAALFAAALMVAWPGTVLLATKERGFYWVSALLVTYALLLMLRLRDRAPRHALFEYYTLGLIGGLAWWETAQCYFVLVPLALWFGLAVRPRLGDVAVAAVGSMCGAAPWLLGLWRYGTAVFEQPEGNRPYVSRVRIAVGELIPRGLGLRAGYFGGWLLWGLGLAVMAVGVAGLVAISVRVVRSFRQCRVAPLVFVVLAFPFLEAIPRSSGFAAEPRYAVLLLPFVVLLVASALRTMIAITLACALAVGFGAANTRYILDFSQQHPFALDLTPTPLGPLNRALTERGITRIYADYWIAYTLDFENDGRSTGALAAPVANMRSDYYQQLVTASRTRVWVLYAGSPRDLGLASALASHGVTVRRTVVGQFAIEQLSAFVDPGLVGGPWARLRNGH